MSVTRSASYTVFMKAVSFVFLAFLLASCSPAHGGDRSVAFRWSFEQDDSLNPDGNPNTNAILEARYSDGTTEKKTIDTVNGSCGKLPDLQTVQCYGAGFGQRYRIQKGETSYVIQKQEFEEATPDVASNPTEYETIAEFPF